VDTVDNWRSVTKRKRDDIGTGVENGLEVFVGLDDRRRLIKCKVDRKRCVGSFASRIDYVPSFFQITPGDRKVAKATSVRDCRRQFGSRRAADWGLHDGVIDLESITESRPDRHVR